MTNRLLRRGALLAVPLACIVTSTASAANAVIHKSDEINLIKKALVVAHAPATQSISCPGDVPIKLGETFKCSVRFRQGGGAVFTIKVDKVDGLHGHMVIIAARKTSS